MIDPYERGVLRLSDVWTSLSDTALIILDIIDNTGADTDRLAPCGIPTVDYTCCTPLVQFGVPDLFDQSVLNRWCTPTYSALTRGVPPWVATLRGTLTSNNVWYSLAKTDQYRQVRPARDGGTDHNLTVIIGLLVYIPLRDGFPCRLTTSYLLNTDRCWTAMCNNDVGPPTAWYLRVRASGKPVRAGTAWLLLVIHAWYTPAWLP